MWWHKCKTRPKVRNLRKFNVLEQENHQQQCVDQFMMALSRLRKKLESLSEMSRVQILPTTIITIIQNVWSGWCSFVIQKKKIIKKCDYGRQANGTWLGEAKNETKITMLCLMCFYFSLYLKFILQVVWCPLILLDSFLPFVTKCLTISALQ
jgi:hypothetical protein